MLVRLLPEQASAIWHIISPMIEAALPPTSGDSSNRMNDILEAVVKNRMQCWVIEKVEGAKDVRIYAVFTTVISKDVITKNNQLLIYSLYSIRPMSMDILLEGVVGLRKFARSVGCDRVVAYSSNRRVLDMAEKVGGNIDTVFIQMGV